MKTPSFLELKTIVEYFSDELLSAQLQEIQATEDGLVFAFYRFTKEPRLAYLVFDLDLAFPFAGLFFENPWLHLKKVKPVGLFLNSHAKNLNLSGIHLKESYGRIIELALGPLENQTRIELRVIPKNTNIIVTKDKKSISWYPKKEISEMSNAVLDPVGLESGEEEIRSIPSIFNSWLLRRGLSKNKKSESQSAGGQNPFDKWKAQKVKDLAKKKKAIDAIQTQIQEFANSPWLAIGEHLKIYGLKNLNPEWPQFLNFDLTASQNIQNCFAKSKAAKVKALGSKKRIQILEDEIANLADLSEQAFERTLIINNQRQMQSKKNNRFVEGRFRKLVLENENEYKSLVCYMGKSAKDNIDLLRKAKAWDYWVHLKDYPSAHAIIHRQKGQAVSQTELIRVATWLVKESFKDKKSFVGIKIGVVYVECRHVRPIKGDKLGRVTYHEGREILIAL